MLAKLEPPLGSFVNIPALTSRQRVALATRHFIEVHLPVSDVHLPVPFATYRGPMPAEESSPQWQR